MRARLGAALTATAVLLAACGGSSSKPYNSADVSFAQEMIPHHEQAIKMAAIAAGQAEGPEVKALATRIQTAQAPEIQQLTGWLQSWEQPLTPAESDGHGDMDHGNGASGMMSTAQMEQLRAVSGSAFDTMFLTMMIEHHQGAVAMAQTEQADGKFADAKKLAGTIIGAQQGEIMEMQGLLGS